MSERPTENLTIGTLASLASVSVETIRFYQRKGLMTTPSRPQGSVRRYDLSDLARLHFIKTAQRLGFQLDEIGDLLKLDEGLDCAVARDQAKLKLAEVRARLSELRRVEDALEMLVLQCERGGTVRCPLIEALAKNLI
jgi:MerR family mercuric resistance operon transcriptional regulator